MSDTLTGVIGEAGRLLFLGLLPLIGIVCLGSIVSAIVQTSLAIQDSSISFGIRFLFFLLSLYIFLPAIVSSLLELTQMAYGI